MENLFHLITNNSRFFTWLLLAIISIALIFQNNPYQRSIWFGSANNVAGSIYDIQSNVTGYFGLREINEDLLSRTGQLEAENLQLRQQLQQYEDAMFLDLDSLPQYRFMIAHVVNNSINLTENYITIDKGSKHGIYPDMGVADQNGVIGIVSKVSEHYALVISVLNPKLRLSVKLKNTDAFGSLVWDGKDFRFANLEDLPRNIEYSNGDTIVTTGYTSSFPKNVPVGTIVDTEDRGGSFLTLRIQLFADFNRLNDVHVIFNEHQKELESLLTDEDE